MSLAEAVDSRREAYANQQLKMLANKPGDAPADEVDVKAVEHNLADHFEFVGTMERFEQSLLLLSKRLGWRPCLYGRLNRSLAAPRVNSATLSALAERNELEREMYAAAVRALDQAIAAEGAAFAAACEELGEAIRWRAANCKDESEAVLVGADTLPKVASYLGAP